jgi:hypothetical protein
MEPDYATDFVHPNLDNTKRIEADIWFIRREHEFAKKIEEVKNNDFDLLWFAYGLLLKYGSELSKITPLMAAKGLPGWLIFAVNSAAKLIDWQARRIKVKVD